MRIFAALMGLGLAATLARAEPVGLAVVEDANWYSNPGYRNVYEPRVRTLFVKDSGGWRQACKYESPNYPVCEAQNFPPFAQLHDFVDDRPTVYSASGFQKGHTCYDEGCNSPGWLDIDPKKIQLDLGDRLYAFSGNTYQPARKPRPVTSMPRPIANPDGWRSAPPAPLALPDQKWLIDAIKGMVICHKGETPPYESVSLKLTARHLKVDRRFVGKVGGSIQLATISDEYVTECKRLGGTVGESPLHVPWFMLSRTAKGESARFALLGRISEYGSPYITSFARPDLIQFGDFDGDGESEALFHLRGYMETGYLLLHGNMLKQARFSYGGN